MDSAWIQLLDGIMVYISVLSDISKYACPAIRNMAQAPLASGRCPQAGEVASQGII
jgi:hypothetical protein